MAISLGDEPPSRGPRDNPTAAKPNEKSSTKTSDNGPSKSKPQEPTTAEGTASKSVASKAAPPKTTAKAAEPAKLLPWAASLQDGLAGAKKTGQPILVRVWGQSCPWCKKLDGEIAKLPLQRELSRWTLVAVDADKSHDDVRQLGVGPIPALRVLTARGRAVASHDGYLSADKLLTWLDETYVKAADLPDEVLEAEGDPSPADVERLVAQFAQREPAQREAAIRRLLHHPTVAAPGVVKSLREGNLSVRLAALELLQQWKAPLKGLDPWRPESLTAERLTALEKWAGSAAAATRSDKLSEEQLGAAREEIAAMLRAEEAAVEAARERLARFGPPLLPEVYARLKQTENDQARERLTALRYRLVASSALALQWPGGVARLAASNTAERRKAAEVLTGRARPRDEALLLELFADPDALVREISLRGLKSVAGARASSALVKLLDDPEPNVRAAVLKTLAENMPASLVPKIAAYAVKETDADLVVHALRALRETRDDAVAESFIQLLKHSSWQVRAAAAENLGKLRKEARGDEISGSLKPVYAALAAALDDADAFVVAKAIEALARHHDPSLVEPLARVVSAHPPLAAQAVGALAGGGAPMGAKAVPHLRKFLTHANPGTRAAAISGLCTLNPADIDKDVAVALSDADGAVRIAAAKGLLSIMDGLRPNAEQLAGDSLDEEELSIPGGFKPDPSLSSRIWDLLLPSASDGRAKKAMKGPPSKGAPSKAPIEEPLATDDSGPPPRPPSTKPPARQPLEAPSPREAQPPAGTAEKAVTEKVVTEKVEPKKAAAEKAAEKATEKVVDKAVEKAVEHPLDQWLVDFRAGRAKLNPRPAWMAQMIGPLQKMLAAPLPEERVAGALALVPLGHQEEALPVLLGTVKSRPASLSEADEALRWLPWPERLSWFDQLAALRPPPDALGSMVTTLYRVSDSRAAPRLWRLLDDASATTEFADTVRDALQAVYWGPGGRYSRGDSSEVKRRQTEEHMLKEAAPFVAQGPRWKRVVALTLISQTSPDEAARLASGIFADKKTEPQLRRDAFRFVLMAGSEAEARPAAVAALASADGEIRRAALIFLADGASHLSVLEEGYYVDVSRQERSREAGAIPPKPTDLDAATFRELAAGDDAEASALAVYLLAIMEQPVDLAPLASYWRAHRQHDLWRTLLVRAIALTDNAEWLPTLNEMYADMRGSEIRSFYWTIRIMTGPDLAKFRQKIRADVGMEALQ